MRAQIESSLIWRPATQHHSHMICDAGAQFNAFLLHKRFCLVKGSAWILLCIISADAWTEWWMLGNEKSFFFASFWFGKQFRPENSVWVFFFLWWANVNSHRWCRWRLDLLLLITCGFIGLENWKRKCFVDQCGYNCCLLLDGLTEGTAPTSQ